MWSCILHHQLYQNKCDVLVPSSHIFGGIFSQCVYSLAREEGCCWLFLLERPKTASIGWRGVFSRHDWIHDPSWICSEPTLLPAQGGPTHAAGGEGGRSSRDFTLGCVLFLCWLLASTTQEHPAPGNNSGLKTISHFSLPLEKQGSYSSQNS